ncbi:tetratricopeptide repeat protein [Candidatus Uabimicrobium sp. HlEnr_7]|uniref:tetratricopeptide repeat protein n=1 Tax=Candidatus Uabimicrobium helgolandensis TaxID=3095367 RepID=UPI003558C29F
MKFVLLLSIFFLVANGNTCVWDEDTVVDELVVKENTKVFDIITGQFAHHSELYYQHRISNLLSKSSLSDREKNNLAVSYIRIKRFDLAEKILLSLLEKNPNKYEVLSNLGVLSKKKRDYRSAVFYMKKALKIKPEGHMGLGDWYLKMLKWYAKYNGKIAQENFLGASYNNQRFYDNFSSESMEKLLTLLRNDQHFIDGFIVLGRVLESRGHKSLAIMSYLKKFKNRTELFRFMNITKKGREIHTHLNAAKKSVKKSQRWLKQFHTVEKLLLKEDKLPSFKLTHQKLKQSGIEKYRPKKIKYEEDEDLWADDFSSEDEYLDNEDPDSEDDEEW